MKVLFQVGFQNKTYAREVDVPFIPNGNVSLWVTCGYYNFKVKDVSMDEIPGNWQVTINLQVLPVTLQLQAPLNFDLDPKWKQ